MHKYTAIFQLSWKQTLQNRKSLLSLSFFMIATLLIFSHLWKIITEKNGLSSFSDAELLWYIALNQGLLLSLPETHEELKRDLQNGKLSYLLPRPISYLGTLFSQAFGAFLANLMVLTLISITFSLIYIGNFPLSLAHFLPIGLFTILAGSLSILFQIAIGLSSFWLREIEPIYWFFEKLLFVLGGLMLPLAAYPGWMQKVAHLTPFPAILGERSALALNFSYFHAISLLLSYIGWGAISLGIVLLAYRKGLKSLNIQGG